MAHLKSLLVCSIAEFIGTMLFVLFGTASTLVLDVDHHPSNESVALGFGIIYAVLVNLTAPFIGGFLNPALTIAMVIRQKLSVLNGVCCVIMQCTGAILGSFVVKFLTPASLCTRGLGVTTLVNTIHPLAGLFVEGLITLVVALVVLNSYDGNRDLCALWCGMVVIASHMFALKYTNCGMNPARSLGPAVTTGSWTHHWVYWVGPILGALLASLIHFLIANFPIRDRDDLEVIGEALESTQIPLESSQQIKDEANSNEISIVPDMPVPMDSPRFRRDSIPIEMKTYF